MRMKTNTSGSPLRGLSVLWLFPLLWIGCTREVELVLPPVPPLLVLNASVAPGEDLSAAVSKSWFLLDSVPDTAVEGASVGVYLNDSYCGEMIPSSLPSDSAYGKNFVLPGCRVRTGDRLRLQVEAPGFEPVCAATSIPAPVEILSLDTSRFLTSREYWGEMPCMRIDLRFRDEPGVRNYYRLLVEKVTEYRKGDEVIVTSSFQPDAYYWEAGFFLVYEDPVFLSAAHHPTLEELDGYTCRGTFPDQLFDGEEYTLKSSFYPVTDSYRGDSVVSVVHYDIRLLAVSESYYRYLTVIRNFSISLGEAYLNGLLEPSSTYTNVEGGFGVVSGYQVAARRITMPFGRKAPDWNPWAPPYHPYD